MNLKRVLIVIFSVITAMIVLFVIYFQSIQINHLQNDEAKQITQIINSHLNNQTLSKDIIKLLKTDLIFALWLKDKYKHWTPIIYDKYLLGNSPRLSDFESKYFKYFVRSYSINIKNNEFIIWINRFDKQYFINNLLIQLIILILIYLTSILIILLFSNFSAIKKTRKNNRGRSENLYDENQGYELTKEEVDGLIGSETINNTEIIEEYKKLWVKNFRVTEEFKDKFPFTLIYNLLRFGITQDQYIKDSLDIATKYFNWTNPSIYICDKDNCKNIFTKQIIDQSTIQIPQKGNANGEIFIPLFPYDSQNIFGYLYFEWQSKNNFKISDILYFLKYMFSFDARELFVSPKRQENIINQLKKDLMYSNDVFTAIIILDNKDQIKIKHKQLIYNKLNEETNKTFLKYFNQYFAFELFPFTFCVIGSNYYKDKVDVLLQNWLKIKKKMRYKIKSLDNTKSEIEEIQDIEISFSCGLSFNDQDLIDPVILINQAHNFAIKAILQGGNQIVFD